MKTFIFNWYENKTKIERRNMIKSATAENATLVFMSAFGNLKKNTINFIQEIDEHGNAVGEKIIPE